MQVKTKKALWLYALFYLFLLILTWFWLARQNQPQQIVAPQTSAAKPLQCVSYAPYYRKGQSPFVPGIVISHAQIDADLKLLATVSECVRTYSVGEGLDYVPQAAEKLGLKVYLGAWIGWIDEKNKEEVNLAAQLSKAYPNTVKALIIGNEVFLRQEQKEAAMQEYIALARKQTTTPITYADVWEYWIKHKRMAQYVDFVTVHILPYWEDIPIGINHAVEHTSNIMAHLKTLFNKPILIGETGWPSVGRQREEAQPSLVNQARYVREFLQAAHENNWQYNVIEAVDQPWKRILEGTVGGYWGLYSTDLIPKFSLTAPVAERHDGNRLIIVSLIGVFLMLGWALLQQANLLVDEQRTSALFGLASLGALSALTVMLQLEYLFAACRDWIEWLALGGIAVLGWLLTLSQPWYLQQKTSAAARGLPFFRLAFLCFAIIASSLLAIDGRYRDYPNLLFVLPALMLSLGTFLSVSAFEEYKRSRYWLCATAALLAAICLALDTTNVAAMLWLAVNLLLAIANWPKPFSPAMASPTIDNVNA